MVACDRPDSRFERNNSQRPCQGLAESEVVDSTERLAPIPSFLFSPNEAVGRGGLSVAQILSRAVAAGLINALRAVAKHARAGRLPFRWHPLPGLLVKVASGHQTRNSA